ncbi:beta-lactamase superfamily domain-containing protein [Triangularia verruculosa]|uniref:Beta-lactamase superfamily domain-containing protein n=1 Tax=Triangularia verruculosa TaxID=2587418 RepID=A0AAN6XHN6_9PEZI|nr:beta-lactamase superfamily domain-containing protein [Triangularia verruculosa]
MCIKWIDYYRCGLNGAARPVAAAAGTTADTTSATATITAVTRGAAAAVRWASVFVSAFEGLVEYASTVTKVTTTRAPSEARSKPHHVFSSDGTKTQRFRNIHPSWDSHYDGSIFPILFRVLWMKVTGNLPTLDTSSHTIPIQKTSFLASRHTPSGKLRATWLGHACYYLEFPSGIRVLFDPVFEDHCAPTFFGGLLGLGPKRYTSPPCAISDLPAVDAVVISHSHYDHLSAPSIQKIKKHHPNAHYFVGLGLGKWFTKTGRIDSGKVTEMDWWDDVDLTLDNAAGQSIMQARISCLPAQHSSGRTPFDKVTTLWCSWAVSSGEKSAYFAGDTGYRALSLSNPIKPSADGIPYSSVNHLPVCPSFAQIGSLRGPFDVGLIPIGAYKPRQYMSCVHSSPEDAVQIFRDTRCERGLEMHWGTWALTFEEVDEPPRLLREALRDRGMEEGVFGVVGIGKTGEF